MSPVSSSSNPLDNLKKTAKRWLKALRANDEAARTRLQRAYPHAPGDPGLRDVQHALAREHGYENWKAMADAIAHQPSPSIDLTATGGRTHADRVATFLEYATWDHHVHGKGDHLMFGRAAGRLLRQHPEIARDSIHTAVVSGDLEEVERILAARPEAAREAGGPRGWTPILYLAYTRLTHQPTIDNAVAIARALLDRGANPNDFYQAGNARYSVLVGVAADGEQDAPRQPQSEALFQLLLERGAEPFDIQVLYNTHFRGEILWWLELIHAHSMQTGRSAEWANPDWPMLDMGGYGTGAGFLLWIALRKRDIRLAEWVLAHGANPDPAPARASGFPKAGLYDEAVREGFTAMADLLVRYGVMPAATVLDDRERFIAACSNFDREAIRAEVDRHPEYLESPDALFAATRRDRADIVEFLLELGVPIGIQDERKQRALHIAAADNALRVAELLIDRGAEVDARSSVYDGTPLQYAVHYWHEEMIDLLGRHSHDIWHLVFTGNVDRVREVLRAQPELAKATRDGHSPLWWLPDDESKALQIVELLLEHGADPAQKSKEGRVAADWALQRGLRDVAARLTQHVSGQSPVSTAVDLARYANVANDLTFAYDSGDAAALQRLSDHYQRRVSWEDLRAGVWQRFRTVREAKGRPGSFSAADAKEMVAKGAGFSSWNAFAAAVAAGTEALGPAYVIDAKHHRIRPQRALDAHDWDEIVSVMKERRITSLDAGGQMTDAALDRISRLDHVTHLRLGGSRQLTAGGLQHLARMPQLEELELGGYPGAGVTDEGLKVLRHLSGLRSFQMCWEPGISDAGVANLAFCDRLEVVNLLGTPTGDGTLRAMAGKANLRRLNTGRLVSDAALQLLHEIPRFKSWQDGEITYSLMSAEAGPTHLLLDGPFTNQGLATLGGLDGLFGLTFFWHASALTSDGIGALAGLANLGFLGCQGALCDDVAMRHIAAIPRLRMLMGQGTVATDDGFIALSRSQTIEYIWGRECANLTGRGFAAMAAMPSLRGLAVSCKHVDDEALSTLPRFPRLRQLMPMDVTDEGFRHVGRCENLDGLWCMYCRDTTDIATAHIAGLPRLKTYYAGATQITDRSLEILGGMPSLESIQLYECKGITDAGLAFLARLPNLREVSLDGLPNVTLPGVGVFPARVRVDYSI